MKFDYEQALERGDALKMLCEAWGRPDLGTETVLLPQARGRVTAHDVRAVCSSPVVRSSKRDGIAVKSSAFSAGVPDGSAWVRGVDYAQADTGDDFPDAFDAVVAVEDIERLEGGGIRFVKDDLEVKPGDGVNPRGSIVKEGSLVVPAHTMLSAEEVAACAVGGLAQIDVLRRVRVAFLPTGSELVPWGSYPERGKNIEANGLLAGGMLESWGADVVAYPMVRDEPALLEKAFDRALAAADIVLVNGGSSRGEEDYNSKMLRARATYFRHGVRVVPGSAVGMAIVDGKPVVNVPGPPLAAFLALDWLIRGVVAFAYGIPLPERQRLRVRMGVDVSKPPKFERLMRVRLSTDGEGGMTCAPMPSDSGVAAQLAGTDAMLSLPIGSEGAHAGDEVEVELLRPLEVIRASWG